MLFLFQINVPGAYKGFRIIIFERVDLIWKGSMVFGKDLISYLPGPLLRSRANKERDSGNWAEAARLYLVYLNSRPDDFGIWVQRGNCLKEAGNFATATREHAILIALRMVENLG